MDLINTGFPSHGQQLIQKRASLEIMSALQKYAPSEILVYVMWSGTDRTAWYIDNPDVMKEILSKWKKDYKSGGWSRQFFNLSHSNVSDTDLKDAVIANGNVIKIRHEGGWYFTQGTDGECIDTIREFYMFNKDVPGIGLVHESIENMVMLENLCKANGIKLVHQYFMDHVYQDIEQYKTHPDIEYLYKQLNNAIIVKPGIYEYLKKFKIRSYFIEDNTHPSIDGYARWCDDILYPITDEKKLFE